MSLKSRWNLAAWEVRLRTEDKEMATQRGEFKHLVGRDEGFRADNNHGLTLSVDQPATGRWLSPETTEITFRIRLASKWIYDAELDTLGASAGPSGWREQELSPYIRKQVIPGLSEGISVERTFVWTPGPDQRQRVTLRNDEISVVEMQVTPLAYVTWRGERIELSQTFSATTIIYPPPKIALPRIS